MDFSTPIGRRFSSAGQIKKAKPKAPPKPVEAPAKKEPTLSLTSESVNLSFVQETVSPSNKQFTVTTPTPEQKKPAPAPTSSDRPNAKGTTITEGGYQSPSYSNKDIQVGANGTLVMMDSNMGALAEDNPVYDLATKNQSTFTGTVTSGSSEPLNVTMNYIKSGAAKENSHAALLATDLHTAVSTTSKVASGGWMSAVGGAGGALLLVHGVAKAATASNTVERLEGVAESNWGGQMAMPTALGATGKTLAQGLGVVGGTIQAGLGVKKAVDGIKTKDKEKIGLGAAEALAGSCWVLSAVGVATGVTLPAFIGITVGAKVYQHRAAIKSGIKKGAQKLEQHFPKTAAAVKSGVKKVADALPKWGRKEAKPAEPASQTHTGAPVFQTSFARAGPAPG